MEAKVIKFDVDWLEIKNLCRGTVSMADSTIEPSQEWKRKLLLAQHSPLRHSLITVEVTDIPYAISTHFVRHHQGIEKYISTSREDRTGVDRNTRSQMDPVTMRLDLNIQAIINISAKRLCFCADSITRQVWIMVLDAIKEYDEDIYWASVSQCVRNAGCCEMFNDCVFYENISEGLTKEQLLDMNYRYDSYNEFRTKARKLKK